MGQQQAPVAIVALHEGAHAVIGIALGYRPLLVRMAPPAAIFRPFQRHEWRHELVIAVAGGEAIRLLGGMAGWDHDDADSADARQIVARAAADGMALVDARFQAERLVAEHRQAITRVAADLVTSGTLTGERVRRVMDGAAVDTRALLLVGLATTNAPRERITA